MQVSFQENVVSFLNTHSDKVYRIIGVVAAVAIAVFLFIWATKRCCFSTKNIHSNSNQIHRIKNLRLDPPIEYIPNATGKPPFISSKGFNLPQEARNDLSVLLEKSCIILKEIDSKISSKQWSLSQTELDNLLKKIKALKSFDRDFQNYEKIADQLDIALEPFCDPSFNGVFPQDLIHKIYQNELEFIYARLAEKYYLDGNLEKCWRCAVKIQLNLPIHDGILLAVAYRYLKEDGILSAAKRFFFNSSINETKEKNDQMEWILQKVTPSDEKDQLYLEWITQLLNQKGKMDVTVNQLDFYDDRLRDFLLAKMAIRELDDELKSTRFLDLFSTNISQTIHSISDLKIRDQLLLQIGKIFYANRHYKHALLLFQSLAQNPVLRDQLIAKVNKRQPII